MLRKSLRIFWVLNIIATVCAFALPSSPSSFSSPSSLSSPFNYWYCVDIAKNIDRSKPYAYNIGELPLVTWFNGSQPMTTLNICKHMGSRLDHGSVDINGCLACPFHGIKHGGKDLFGQTVIHEDKLWWSYNPTSKLPPSTPFWKNKDYNTIMLKIDVKANVKDCLYNTFDINHYAYIHDNLFGKKMSSLEYNYKKKDNNSLIMRYKYAVNKKMAEKPAGTGRAEEFNNFQIFHFPFTSTAILALNKKERLIINSNFVPLAYDKTRWIVTVRHNFWKSYFAKIKLDMIMKYILHQDQVQLSKQASDNMLKQSVFYKLRLLNEDHFMQIFKMFRTYQYPDMISVMRLYQYHDNLIKRKDKGDIKGDFL